MTFHELCCDVSQICVITILFQSFSSFTFLLRLGFKARERCAEEAELGCEEICFISGCLFVVFHDKYPELKLGKYLRVLAKV